MSDIAYEILVHDERGKKATETVIGYQVGRFAVRHKGAVTNARTLKGEPSPLEPWLVDHISTGVIVIAVQSFEEAMLIADDVSRFSKHDPDTTDTNVFFEQIGPEIIEWLKFVIRTKKTIAFRSWKARQTVTVKDLQEHLKRHLKGPPPWKNSP